MEIETTNLQLKGKNAVNSSDRNYKKKTNRLLTKTKQKLKDRHFLFKWSQFRKIINRLNHLAQHSTTLLLLSSFQLNGHTLGFHPQTQKLEPVCTA